MKEMPDPKWAKQDHGDGKYKGLSATEWQGRRKDQEL
jgi:hypothetical protein